MGNRIRSSPSQNKDCLVTRSIHSGKETDVETRAVKRPLVRLNNYGFFHVSVGLENPDDLVADPNQALEIIRGD